MTPQKKGSNPWSFRSPLFHRTLNALFFTQFFGGCHVRVICDPKFLTSPVSTFINTFRGTLKNSGFLKYRQKFDIFSKIFHISRNMHFTDMRPWGQKLSKVSKETFSKLRTHIKVIWGTLENFQIMQIIVHFSKSPPQGTLKAWPISGPPGEKQL